MFLLVMLPIIWIASASPEFRATYPQAQFVRENWRLFAIYEACFLTYFLGWEYIWRGYMLFGLKGHTGAPTAILLQMIPFVILHVGKPFAEAFGSIFAAIALGALAVRARSFWYCVVVHWGVMIMMDLFSTWRFRGGIDGFGFDAIARLLTLLFAPDST
jgi:membrane protease YdiL (CAAX protease family)